MDGYDVEFWTLALLQDTGFPSWGNITMTLSTNTALGWRPFTYDRETTTHPLHTFLEIQHNQIINVFIIITATLDQPLRLCKYRKFYVTCKLNRTHLCRKK